MSEPAAFTLGPDDLETLEEFSLAWRWTEPNQHLLTEEELERIRPLAPAAAQRAWNHSLRWHPDDVWDARPSPEWFGSIETLEQPHEHDADGWLAARLASARTPVVVTWQPDTAVLTDAALFQAHWEGFCYPASDDVDVWPLDGSWVVTYWHEEQLWFGRA